MNKLIFIPMLFLLACNSEQNATLKYIVKNENFAVSIPAKGELFAAKATVVSTPVSRTGVQNISWLAPEFSMVKQGDVIARFDGEAMLVKSREKENELAITKQDIIEKTGVLSKELDAISKDILIIDQEKLFAEKFSIDDERIRSKLEIIDSLQNTAYLGSKQDYLNWKSDSFNESSAGDMGLLKMQQDQHQGKLDLLNDSLNQLEIKAPHDGLLVYKTNWRGEKPRAGQSMWPGEKIAELPNITQMKAKLYVIESEAIDLAEGKKVNLQLFAYANLPFKGVVESVAPFPASIKRGDPQKYFEVIVALDEQNPKLFVPGRKLQANIEIAKPASKLIVPLQAIYTKENQSFVYLYQDDELTMAAVTLGQASLSHVEILTGLEAGQEISLMDQEQN
ncbi:hypothetical protein CJF42_03290 [Pseudoalteromonas sp. NBT06-2]|uniref:efflux RND transporter periplasmic adaptor subunit n=1 Tax=Pseudoalteromonas sp. NBT06-2 TaxID=2025950 RepID=UPI000BA74601|nr:HlyD family efflux transporter periplasmic adaptor subunit [Pseudoalteromonas sp. NBT06-2]PAJ75755.1 hypothetical protein CJF42_03290 [Pseudoalteromonas sp. NBT06-2]